jgi:hypothetical protein
MEPGYRAARRPDAYDPNVRVRPCDACGAGLVVGDHESTASCEACGREQKIPAARPLPVPPSPAADESERIAHLATQLDHQWLTPKSVERFGGNVLEDEIGEARALWVKLRENLEAEPDDPERALELMCVTFALHAALPAGTREERLARRALAESSAEAQRDPLMRQKTMYNLVIGAVRAGELEHARGWLARMDAKSRGLDADSSYRVSAAALATELGDHTEVLRLLGRTAEAVPIHASSRTFAAVLRANALEKLGSLDDAVNVLYADVVGRHSALAQMASLQRSLPADWTTCERSLPLVIERDRDRLVDNIPSRSNALLVVALGVPVLVATVTVLESWQAPLAVAGVVAIALAAYTLVARDRRRRLAIVRGCIPVEGRILSVRPRGQGSEHELEVTVEREGLPDERVTTIQTFNSRIQQMELEGCAFDALWNPAHPSYFARITIHVAGDQIARDDAKRQRTG